MMVVQVESLVEVALREVWSDEASLFTPWLAENPGHLSEALGMQLELVGIEVSTYLVPTMMKRIWRLPDEVRERYDVSSLKVVWHVAEPWPVWLKQAWIDWLGPEKIFEKYGGAEAVIQEHEGVHSCAVIGLPDEDKGNVVHAIVEADPAAVPEDELRQFLAERLVVYNLPRSIEYVDTPLRDDAGKVRRSALRAERLSGACRR